MGIDNTIANNPIMGKSVKWSDAGQTELEQALIVANEHITELQQQLAAAQERNRELDNLLELIDVDSVDAAIARLGEVDNEQAKERAELQRKLDEAEREREEYTRTDNDVAMVNALLAGSRQANETLQLQLQEALGKLSELVDSMGNKGASLVAQDNLLMDQEMYSRGVNYAVREMLAVLGRTTQPPPQQPSREQVRESMTQEQQQAYDWALKQDYQSVAARYARTLAQFIKQALAVSSTEGRLAEENARLREAVRQISDCCSVATIAGTIARAALVSSGGGDKEGE